MRVAPRTSGGVAVWIQLRSMTATAVPESGDSWTLSPTRALLCGRPAGARLLTAFPQMDDVAASVQLWSAA